MMAKKITEMNKFHEIELEKLFDWTQALASLRVQVGIFFATANVGALSLGVSQAKADFFLFAALLFWALMLVDIGIRFVLAHTYYRIFCLHKLYVNGDTTFSPLTYSRLATKVAKVVNMENITDQKKALWILPLKNLNFYGFWLPLLASVIEIAFGLFLWIELKWPLV